MKIRLELQFKPKVIALFRTMKIDYRIGVATGKRSRADTYQARWESELSTHYKRVQKAFKSAIEGNRKQDENEDDNLDDEILAALLLWIQTNAPRQADLITQTNQRDMDLAIEQARQAFSDEGRIDYSNRELATVSAIILGRKFAGRLAGITTLETQAPAEATKLIEAYADSGLPPAAVVTREPTGKPASKNSKMWVTMRDERVRAWHREADGQTVPIEQPFIVGGERLMFPGDAHLGASIGNLINCRCAALYNIVRA